MNMIANERHNFYSALSDDSLENVELELALRALGRIGDSVPEILFEMAKKQESQ